MCIRDSTGQNGCLAPVGDVAVFTAAAVALAADGGLRERLGRAARQTAQALDWPQVLERFEAALLAVHQAATTGEAYHGDARLA